MIYSKIRTFVHSCRRCDNIRRACGVARTVNSKTRQASRIHKSSIYSYQTEWWANAYGRNGPAAISADGVPTRFAWQYPVITRARPIKCSCAHRLPIECLLPMSYVYTHIDLLLREHTHRRSVALIIRHPVARHVDQEHELALLGMYRPSNAADDSLGTN